MTELSREERLAEFAWQATRAGGLAETAAMIVEFARLAVRADAAGITLIRARGVLVSIGATDQKVALGDRLQHELREGPCVETAAQIHGVNSADLATDDRWPRWGPQAADLGLRSILSATLHTAGDRRLGAINLYGYACREFDTRDIETLRLFAAHATAALWSAIEIDTLHSALDSRTRIGQAAGILMHRYGLDADQATAVLKRYSQQTNTKLRVVAHDVIAQHGLPDGPHRAAARLPGEG